MKFKTILFIIFLLCNSASSQWTVSENPEEYNIAPYQQQYVLHELDAFGYTPSTFSSATHIVNANPALSADITRPVVGVSFEFDSKIKDITDYSLSHDRRFTCLPQSFVFLLPIKSVTAGLGFSQKLNSAIKWPQYMIRTLSNSKWKREYITDSNSTSILHYSALLATKLTSIHNIKINFGVQLDVDHLLDYTETCKSERRTRDIGISWKAGLNLDYSSIICLGLYYNKGSYLKNHPKYKSTRFVLVSEGEDHLDTEFDRVEDDSEPPTFFVKTPNKLHIGVSLFPIKQVRFGMELSHKYWSNIDKNYENTLDCSFAMNYFFKDIFTLTTGYLFDNSFYPKENEYLNEQTRAEYLLLGGEVHFSTWALGVIVADSHLSSGEWREQTITKISISKSW